MLRPPRGQWWQGEGGAGMGPGTGAGTVMISTVESVVTFADLALSDFTSEELQTFQADFKEQMAAEAGVGTSFVSIESVSEGSLAVQSTVTFNEAKTADGEQDTFASTLESSPAGIFTFSGWDEYGAITSEGVGQRWQGEGGAGMGPGTGAGTVMISTVESVVTFADLALSDFTSEELQTFQADFKEQMAAEAGVGTSFVSIESVSEGSLAVQSTVTFNEAKTADGEQDTFASTLESSPADIFTFSGWDAYGAITSEGVVTSTAAQSSPQSDTPTGSPTRAPTVPSTRAPTGSSTSPPKDSPTRAPTGSPSHAAAWTHSPTIPPSVSPTTRTPTTRAPTGLPPPPPWFFTASPPPCCPPMPRPPRPPPPPTLVVAAIEYDILEPEYEEALDEEAPVITLLGEAYAEVEQFQAYVDAGAEAKDEVDGLLAHVVTGLDAIDTSKVSKEPYLVDYTAQDAAGNLASPVTRMVAVVTPCPAPSFLCEDQSIESQEVVCATCTTTSTTDAGGVDTAAEECICLTIIEVEDSGVHLEEYVPPMDTTPPVIELRPGDESILAITNDGLVLRIHQVMLFTEFEDPGVDAYDDMDGNLTSQVVVRGSATVNTDVVTLEDAPYVLSYTVSDAAGNAAQEVRRRVYVYNPCDAGELPTCNNTACTEGGLCANAEIPLETNDVEEEEPSPPTVALIGQQSIDVEMGAGYSKCPEGVGLDVVCDRGATAVDEVEGDITTAVLACSPDGVSYKFSKKGVQACGVDTHVPGLYQVLFEVFTSHGTHGSATRNVTVRKTCPTGETLCRDQISCSEAGTCLQDLESAQVEEVVGNTPPAIALVTSEYLLAVVEIRQHSEYTACTPGAPSNHDTTCEEGATASDEEDGDLTARVLACPPSSCLASGCAGHEFATKGVAACLDTSAEVGTVFEIEFLVFDSNVPAANASVANVSLAPCASYSTRVWCYAVAWDEVDGDVTATLEVALLNGTSGAECAFTDVSEGQCRPATYYYEYAVADEASNSATRVLTVVVTEQADVSSSLRLASSAAAQGEAEAEAAMLMDPGSPEAAAFQSGIATMLADSTSSDGGLEVAPADVNITRAVVATAANNSTFELLVSFTVVSKVAVPPTIAPSAAPLTAMPAATERSAAPTSPPIAVLTTVPTAGPALAVATTAPTEELSSVEVRALEVEQALVASANSSAAGGASLAGYLAAAAAELNASLSTEVEALSNVTTQQVTVDVDELAAYTAMMSSILEDMSESLSDTLVTAEAVEVAVAEHAEGPDPDTQLSRQKEGWSTGYDVESSNIQTFSDSLAQAMANAEALRALQADLELAANSALQASAQDGNALEFSVIQTSENASSPQTHDASSTLSLASDNECAEAATVRARASILPPHPITPACPQHWPLLPSSQLYAAVRMRPAAGSSHCAPPFKSWISTCCLPHPASSDLCNDSEELQIRWLLSSEIPPPPPVPPPLPPPQPSPAAPLASSAARRLLGRQKSGAGTSSEDREDGALDVVDVDDFELANLRYYRAVQENRHYTVSRTNQVLAGLVLTAKRRSKYNGSTECSERFSNLGFGPRGNFCYRNELDLEPYGYDASLNINSDRYNPGLEGLQEDYYGPESVAYNAYDEPRYRPFMPVGEGKHALGTTPAIFLSQVSADSARSLSLFLENSGFLSEDTQEVAASMLLYNAPARVLAYTRATFGFSPGGAYEITSEVTPMDEEFWEPWRDIPKAMCLSIWAVGVVVMWTHDMRGYDAKRRELKLSHAAALRGSLMLQHGTSTLPFLALLWYLGILLRQSTFYMLDTYEVYHDSYALANPLLGTRKNGSEELRMWELEPDTADFNYLSANLKISQMVAQAQHLYWVLQMFGLFLALMNIFRLMAFHSYLAIMSNIWEHAGSHLGHFAATLVFSLTGYAGVLTIVLGEHCEELSTFVDAYSYLLDAFSQQHLESCLPEGLVVGPMRRAVMNGLGFTFTLHIIFTTYNVLLSVFVDAIKIQREMNQGTPSAFVELASFARSHLRGRCVAYPGDRAVLRLLAAAQAHAQRTSPAALAVLNSEPATAPGKREVGEMAPATEGPKEAHPGRLAPVEEQVAVDMAPGVHALGMNIECEELVELLRALVAHPKAEVACIHVALELGIMRLDDVLGPGLPSANILQERVPDGLAGCLMRSPVARCKLSASHPRLTTKRTAKKAPSAALRRLSKAAQDLRRAHTAALQAQQLRTRRLQGSLAQLSAQRSLQAVGLRLGELHTGAPQHRPHGNHWEALFPLGSQLEALLAEEEIQRCARFSLIGLLERASSGARNSPSTRAAARLPVSATPPMPATPAGPHLPAATPGGASRRGDPLAVDKVEMDLTARQWTAALIASAGPQKATVLALQPDAAEEEPGADTRWESSSSLGSASSGSRKSFHALLDLEKRERQARVAMAQAAGHHQRAQAAPPKEAVACVDASCPMPDGLMSSEVGIFSAPSNSLAHGGPSGPVSDHLTSSRMKLPSVLASRACANSSGPVSDHPMSSPAEFPSAPASTARVPILVPYHQMSSQMNPPAMPARVAAGEPTAPAPESLAASQMEPPPNAWDLAGSSSDSDCDSESDSVSSTENDEAPYTHAATVPTTQPLLATGVRTFVAGLQSASARHLAGLLGHTRAAVAPRDPAPDERPEQSELQARRHPQTPAQATAGRSQGGLTPLLPWSQFSAMAPLTEPHTGTGDTGMPMGDVDMPAATPPATDDISSPGVPGHAAAAAGGSQGTVLQGRSDDANGCQRRQVSRARHLLKVDTSDAATDQPEKPPLSIGGERSWPQHLQQEQAPSHIETAELLGDHDPSAPPSLAPFEIPSEWGEANTGSSLDEPASTVTGTAISRAADPSDAVADARERPFSAFDSGVLRPHVSLEGSARQQQRQPVAVAGTNMSSLHTAVRSSGLSGARPRSGASGAHGDARVSAEAMSLGSEAIGADSSEAERDGQEPQHGISGFWQLGQRPKVPQRVPSLKEEQGTEPIPIPEFETSADLSKIDAPKPSSSQLFHPQKLAEYSEAEADTPEAAPGLDSILSSSWRPKRTLEPTHSYAAPQQGEGARTYSPSSAGSERKFARLPGDELVSSIGTSRYARGAVADYSEAEADTPEAAPGLDSILSSSWRPKRTLEPTHSYAEPQQGEGIRMHSPSSAGSEWKFARLPGDELVSSIGTSRYARGAVADYSEAEADAPEALEGFIPV
ncbi:hypothetical protein CYMTET_24838 [Cymbomonas tetramitiformis]|uniref:Pesticidal crystal protein Cry22Aa Ig-like domain-containing protein n=1 Tax=Cymbomonas tetramitiformis TaxID=36881 RepID=A0AAE0FVS1_9CHLO|nr:hypothetical protein CYMTET_24838 [Cymbomonas tetramitiformis]